MNKTILITGASSGLGLALTELLLQRNNAVVGTERKRGAIEQSIGIHNGLIPLQLDITDEESIADAIVSVRKQVQSVDVLINNAGVCYSEKLANVDVPRAKRLFDVNVFGMMAVTKAVMPLLNDGALVINISSTDVDKPCHSYGVYAASKFAVDGYTNALALELASKNIKVFSYKARSFRSKILVKEGIVFNTKASEVALDIIKNYLI